MLQPGWGCFSSGGAVGHYRINYLISDGHQLLRSGITALPNRSFQA